MRAPSIAGLALLAVACGGAPPPAPPAAQPAPRSTRVVIEDGEEPEDGVEIVSTRGRMDPAAVTAGLQPHTQALSDCYMTRVGTRRWLGGSAVLHWDISRTGEITAVKLAESTLGAWPVEQCLVEIAKAATFTRPIGGDADFSVPLDFSAKGNPQPWSDDQVIRAIGGQRAALAACERPDSVDAEGKVVRPHGKRHKRTPPPQKVPVPEEVMVTLYVGAPGKAESVGFASPTSVIDPAWAACAERVVLHWRLPDPGRSVAKLAFRYVTRP